MASVIQKKFDACIENAEIVEVYRDRLTREALVGNVLQQSAGIVVMRKVDEIHGPDGLVAIRLRDVTRLRRGGRRLEHAQHYEAIAGIPSVALLELTSAMTILQNRFGHVSVYVESLDEGVCFIGEHGELDDEFVVLTQFGTFDALDRSEITIRTSEITRVEAGGRYEAELMRRFSLLSDHS